MDSLSRKRNVSDGDSGFDSSLSSRSSSISLEESPEYGKLFDQEEELESKFYFPTLKEKFASILTTDEDIIDQDEFNNIFIITNKVTGCETYYKPPSRLKFSCTPPQVGHTFSTEEYDRSNQIPRSHLFHSRLEYELEKQIAKMSLVEVDLVMNSSLSPPPSLGIRVIGVNMIHGVQDKLNIYVKRVVEDSVAGLDGRIKVNDHIIEVNGISLVGVSQKLAAQTLSNCAICPETGTVHFVLARPKSQEEEEEEVEDVVENENVEQMEEDNCDHKAVREQNEEKVEVTKFADDLSSDTKFFTKPENAFLGNGDSEFEGRHSIRLRSGSARLHNNIGYAKELLRFSKKSVIIGSVLLVAAYLAVFPKKK